MREHNDMMSHGCPDFGGGHGARNVLVQTQRAYSLYITAGETHTIELLRYIDATAIVSGTLEVRLHSGDPSTWPLSTVVTVTLEDVSPAPDDPASLYTDGVARATVTFNQSPADPAAPALKVGAISAPIAGYLRCVLEATADEASGQIDFTIGINVVGRDGG